MCDFTYKNNGGDGASCFLRFSLFLDNYFVYREVSDGLDKSELCCWVKRDV